MYIQYSMDQLCLPIDEKQEEREHSGQDLSELGEASKLTSDKLE